MPPTVPATMNFSFSASRSHDRPSLVAVMNRLDVMALNGQSLLIHGKLNEGIAVRCHMNAQNTKLKTTLMGNISSSALMMDVNLVPVNSSCLKSCGTPP